MKLFAKLYLVLLSAVVATSHWYYTKKSAKVKLAPANSKTNSHENDKNA